MTIRRNFLRGQDNYRGYFSSMGDFLLRLEEMEANTERRLIESNKVKVFELEDYINQWFYGEEDLGESLGVDVTYIQDTASKTNMVVEVEKKPYLLGDSSWISIKNRIDIYGKGFDALPTKEKAEAINARLKQIEEDVLVVIMEGKVRAIMSKDYKVVPSCEVIGKIEENIKDRFETYELVEGYADYKGVRCKILFTELEEELSAIYELPKSYIPGLIIESSDTGYSANKVRPFWSCKGVGSFIIPGEEVYAKHKGRDPLGRVVENLPNIFLKYQNTLKKFSELLLLEVERPVTLLRRSCKELKLAQKHTKPLIEQFEVNYDEGTRVTAYDVCCEILTLPMLVAEGERQTLEEKVGKAINLNYERLMSE